MEMSIIIAAIAAFVLGALITALWARATNAGRESRLQSIQSDYDTECQKLEGARSELATLRDENVRLAERVESKQAHLSEKLTSVAAERDHIKRNSDALTESLDQTRAELGAVRSENSVLVERLESVQQQARRQQQDQAEQLEQSRAQNRSLSEAIDSTRKELSDQREKNLSIAERFASLKKNYDENSKRASEDRQSLVNERNELLESLEQNRSELSVAKNRISTLSERLETEQRHAESKLKTLMEAREQMTHQFRTLSQEILDQKAKAFNETSKASLEPLINPLREHIGRFEKQVKQTYDAEAQQRSALAQQIKTLAESNKAIAEDATNLTRALRGESKTQGNWGEMILETVLERSGLEKGAQYDTQFAATTEDGRRQLPDAVVHLPESRSLVIDSKVSLTAYLRVQEAEDDNTRRAALADHIRSVRKHLKDLSDKNYQGIDAIRTLDYVFMFVPSEAAYVEALRGDFDLQRDALDANIALVSPTTLMPMLRAVENLWRLDKQEKNAEAIAARAGTLYDKFVGFIEDIDKISKNLGTLTKSVNSARTKLTDGQGNLVRQAEMLRKMGAKTSKNTPSNWQNDARLGVDRDHGQHASDPELEAQDDAESGAYEEERES